MPKRHRTSPSLASAKPKASRASISPEPARTPAPPTGATATASRWRRLPEERPGHILSAALDAFVEKGFAATRLEDIAERAGISKGTLYLYFENKEELFKAAVRENVVPIVERAEHQVDVFQGSSRDLLVEIVRGWWNAMHESHTTGLPKLVLAESSNFPDAARVYFDEVVVRVRGLFARALRRGIESGEFRAVDVDYTVRVAMAPLTMALLWKHSMVKCQIDCLDFDRHLNALIDVLLYGVVKPSPEAAKGQS
jgi:AcrR family transcriptional regulator